MTSGFKIEPAALNAHASGSKEAAGHFGSLAQLLEQARVSDDCFGPLGELMAYKYFDSLKECQDLADQAKTFLDAIADKTTLAAQAYQGHEDATTDAVTGLGKELADGGGSVGSLSDVNHAGDAGRKSYLEQNGGYGSSWLSTSTEVSSAGSPPDVAIAAVHTRMEQIQLVTSPGQSGEFSEGAAAFADEVRGLQQILELAADLFDAFVEIVIDILQELVMGLIIEWLAALAASWITAGASVGAAGAATTGEVAVTGGRLGMKVKQLLGKLRPLIEELEKILQKLRTGPLKKVVERVEGLRNGNFLEKRVADLIDKNPIAKILTKADAATGASRTGNRFANALGVGSHGADSLTTNLTETGLRLAGMSGTSSVGKAAWRGSAGNVVEQGIEQGVKYGYNQSQTDSAEERREATDRGFSLEE